MTHPLEGQLAPILWAPDQDGQVHVVPYANGPMWTLVWWEPSYLTQGCASCGGELRSQLPQLTHHDIFVYGANYRTPESNRRWADFYGLGFPVLTTTRDMAESYGAARPLDDEWTVLPRPMSVLIDPEGLVRKVWSPVVHPPGHAQEVLAEVARLTVAQRSAEAHRKASRGLWGRLVGARG